MVEAAQSWPDRLVRALHHVHLPRFSYLCKWCQEAKCTVKSFFPPARPIRPERSLTWRNRSRPFQKNGLCSNSCKRGNIPLFHPIYWGGWTIVYFQPHRQACQERMGRFWHSRTENTSCLRQWELLVVAATVKDYAKVPFLFHSPPCCEGLDLQLDQLCLTGFRHCLPEHQSTST